jgi:hypothetical protein
MSAIGYWSNMYWWGHIACIVGLISLHLAAPKTSHAHSHTGSRKKEKEGASVAALGANPNGANAAATAANGSTKKDE